jgi:hypothetical protein
VLDDPEADPCSAHALTNLRMMSSLSANSGAPPGRWTFAARVGGDRDCG